MNANQSAIESVQDQKLWSPFYFGSKISVKLGILTVALIQVNFYDVQKYFEYSLNPIGEKWKFEKYSKTTEIHLNSRY